MGLCPDEPHEELVISLESSQFPAAGGQGSTTDHCDLKEHSEALCICCEPDESLVESAKIVRGTTLVAVGIVLDWSPPSTGRIDELDEPCSKAPGQVRNMSSIAASAQMP